MRASSLQPSRVAEFEAASTDAAMGVTFNKYEESLFPDGSPAVVCTCCAEQIIARFGGVICGWESESNPTAVIAHTQGYPGGHDFALIEDRYLVDPWAVNVEQSSTRAAFDLFNAQDRAEVRRLYGDPKTWTFRPTGRDVTISWVTVSRELVTLIGKE